jgi:hypothetical protein
MNIKIAMWSGIDGDLLSVAIYLNFSSACFSYGLFILFPLSFLSIFFVV